MTLGSNKTGVNDAIAVTATDVRSYLYESENGKVVKESTIVSLTDQTLNALVQPVMTDQAGYYFFASCLHDDSSTISSYFSRSWFFLWERFSRS